jgi:mono/diheme cytochrome c family protein
MRRAPEGRQRLRGRAAPLLAAGFFAACGGGTSSVGGGTGAVTYYKDVLPIVNQRCSSCHAPDGIAPFAFTSYDDTRGYAGLMASAARSGEMPPWMPAAGCGDFRDVRRLAAADVEKLERWNEAGAPAGNPADAPRPTLAAAPALGAPSATLDPGIDYHPNSALTDDYHCSLIDPGLTASQDLVGFDVHPGTPSSVHHVLLFAVPAARIAAAQARDAAEPGPGWTCFAGSGVDGTPVVGGWVPGSGATSFPAPTGIQLSAGTQIVMQIHYNLLVQKQVSDRTTAGLYYADQPVAKPAWVYAILNDKFLVPAGTKSQTVTADLPLPTAFALWGVVPHMHLHGTEIKMTIEHADGSSTCAVDIPSWDFHWQQFYYYKLPVPAVAGDTVHLECTFDNSPARQPNVGGVVQPPADLRWGEKTTDEMCLNYLYFTLP